MQCTLDVNCRNNAPVMLNTVTESALQQTGDFQQQEMNTNTYTSDSSSSSSAASVDNDNGPSPKLLCTKYEQYNVLEMKIVKPRIQAEKSMSQTSFNYLECGYGAQIPLFEFV